MRKKIYILYTGGTFGMVKSTDGYKPTTPNLQDIFKQIKDSFHTDFPEYKLDQLNPILDSSNITSEHWELMLQKIKQHYEEYHAFIMIHGTDTMAYTASALSFFTKHLNKPIILTGSQIPYQNEQSDAIPNLVNSILVAMHSLVSEVCICFAGKLFRGCRSTKQHANHLDAFDSPNYPKLGGVYNTAVIDDLPRLLPKEKSPYFIWNQKIQTFPFIILPIFPNCSDTLFTILKYQKFKVIFLQTYGTGNIPSFDKKLLNILEEISGQDTLFVNITQCHQGSIEEGKYETSAILQKIGVLSSNDMTVESSITKMLYLLNSTTDIQQVKSKFIQNIRGELTPQTS